MKLNFFGDYAANNTSPILDESIQSLIERGDANIVNVEAVCEISGSKPLSKSGSILSQSESNIKWLCFNGFNGFTLANNHMMDYGEANAIRTIDLLGADNCCGFGNYDAVLNPLVFKDGEVKIAIISVTHYEFGIIIDKFDQFKLGVGAISDPRIHKRIRDLKESGYYVVIVSHAGIEHIEQPLPEWRAIYHSFIDAGACAVIGSHPHIIQGWEKYEGCPIFYSLGNFYFPSKKRHDIKWCSSLCVQLVFEKGKMTFDVIPVEFIDNIIKISVNKEIEKYISRVNSTLSHDEDYLGYINAQSERLYDLYTASLSVGGWEGVYRPFLFIKRFFKILLFKPDYIHTHLINNLRCESHRWMIVRALKHRLNIQ